MMSIVVRKKSKTRDSRPAILSGLVILSCLFQPVFCNEYLPVRMFFGDVLPSMDNEKTALWLDPYDTASLMRASNSFSYDDFYHAEAPNRDQIAESECLTGSALLKRRTWALMPWWNMKKGFVRNSNSDDSYLYEGALASEKAGISGWISRGPLMAACYCGWDFDNTIEPTFGYVKRNLGQGHLAGKLYGLHGDYFLTIGGTSGGVFGAFYASKSLLPLVFASVTNTDDGASVPFGFAAVARTLGTRISVSRPIADLRVDAGYTAILSDSAAVSGNTIPVTADAGAYHGSVAINLPRVTFQPGLEISIAFAAPKLRGFDGPGGPMFFYLDKNSLDIESVAMSGRFWRKTDAGLTAEHCSFSNDAAGRLDPYLFSSMFVFMPTKYKIDFADFSYTSYGVYARRTQSLLSRWDLDATLSASRILARAAMDTREYDFTEFFGIPVLRNPVHTELLDEDVLLIVAGLNNSFTYKKFTLHADVQQAIPLDLKRRGNGGGNPQSNGTSSAGSVRGGTRYRFSMDFLP